MCDQENFAPLRFGVNTGVAVFIYNVRNFGCKGALHAGTQAQERGAKEGSSVSPLI